MPDNEDRTWPHSDRRQFQRHPVSRLPSVRASILAGPDVEVINVSRRGLLLESVVRLTPGAGVCLNVDIGDQVHRLGGRVARVDTALIDGKLRYRAGVMLDEECAIFDPTPRPEGPDVAPEPEVPPVPDVVERYESEIAALRWQLVQLQREHAESNRALDMITKALESSETYRKRTAEAQTAERARWQEERNTLEERLRVCEEQNATLQREFALAAENERRRGRQHEEERAQLELALRDTHQRLTEAEAGRAALLVTTQNKLKASEQEREDLAAQEARLAAQLETTESWCADQQDLLHQLHQEIARVFALLNGSRRTAETHATPKPVTESLDPLSLEAMRVIEMDAALVPVPVK